MKQGQPFSLKAAMRAIGERRTAEDIAEQDELNRVGRARLNPGSASARISRAVQYEADMVTQLRMLRKMPDSELKQLRIANALDRIGELAAEQGDYSRAARISHSLERRLHYRSIRDAVRRDDDVNCDCEGDRIVHPAVGEFVEPAIKAADTIVGKAGELLTLDRCRKCGFMNAR